MTARAEWNPMPMNVFANALKTSAGQAWLRRLPGLVVRVAQDWNLRVQGVLDHGGVMSWVALADDNGTPAILKCTIPDDDARHEAAALDFFGGNGAVRLRKVLRDGSEDDGFVLLLDRCEPGDQLLAHITSDDSYLRVMADVLNRLWRRPALGAPFERLVERATGPWQRHPATKEPHLQQRAAEVTAWLLAEPADDVLCHGDLHPENILLSSGSMRPARKPLSWPSPFAWPWRATRMRGPAKCVIG
jgi:streptomycin 6-kinase